MPPRTTTAARRAALLALLLSSAAAPALAQAIPTAPTGGSGISTEQALALTARMDALERRNNELEKQVQSLKTKSDAGDKAAKDPNAVKASLSNGRPTLATADGRFTASLRGYLQLDGALYNQDAPGPLATDFRRGSVGDATEADRARDMADGTNFRRVRFGLEGKAFGDWDYNFLFDFGGSGTEAGGVINQAWVQYSGLPYAKLRIGAFAPPAGMDDATSATGAPFIERAAITEVVRGMAGADARTGAGVFANGKRWNVSAVITGNTVGQTSFDEQLGFVGRAAFTPFVSDQGLVHVGANLSAIIHPPKSGPDVAPGVASPIRFRERVESRVEGVRLVDTGSIDSRRAVAWGLEGAGQYKQFMVQSEYFHIDLDRRASTLADPSFSGWYVQGAWTLTGQPRRYSIATATFDAPKVDKPFSLKTHEWGVWELAARYSDLDLNNNAGALGTSMAADGIRGGEQKIWTLGLSWYPTSTVRFEASYQDVDVNRLSPGGTAFGAGVLTPAAGTQIGQTLQVWSFRTQYAF